MGEGSEGCGREDTFGDGRKGDALGGKEGSDGWLEDWSLGDRGGEKGIGIGKGGYGKGGGGKVAWEGGYG